MTKVEFVSYDGSFPALCLGELKVKVDGQEWTFPEGSLRSTGFVEDDPVECVTRVTKAEWIIIKWPEGFPNNFTRRIVLDMINEKIEHGCCGGCGRYY